MFGRATIRLGIGPHSSFAFSFRILFQHPETYQGMLSQLILSLCSLVNGFFVVNQEKSLAVSEKLVNLEILRNI